MILIYPPVNPDNPDTPTTYDVNISLELWDQYGNDLIYTDRITGRYESGEKINIVNTIKENNLTIHVAERIPADAAAGRICAETVFAYPPGIPLIVPGEVVNGDQLMRLLDQKRAGVALHSTSGALPQAICVLRENCQSC